MAARNFERDRCLVQVGGKVGVEQGVAEEVGVASLCALVALVTEVERVLVMERGVGRKGELQVMSPYLQRWILLKKVNWNKWTHLPQNCCLVNEQ